MRTRRAIGMLIATAATCLLMASSAPAGATGQPATGPPAHPLPRFEALIAALQAPAAQTPAAPAHARPAKTSQVPLPPGEGFETTKKLCSGCHGTDVFARQRHTREKWNGIIDNMVSKGMEASDDDLEKMADYLGANLGPDSPVPPPATPPAATTPPK